jgi:subtilase family serine protease
MKRPVIIVAATALAATTIAAIAGGSTARADSTETGGHGNGLTTVSGSAAPFATANRVVGAVAGSESLTIQVWLTPQTAAAESYATAVSTPGNALFGHFLRPAAYTARFGASSTEARGVEAWLQKSGFTGVATDAQRDYVQATAPVSVIDSAFGVRLDYFRPTAQVSAGTHPLRANDRPVSVPASIAASVLGVTGLDNAAPQATYLKPGNLAAPARASDKTPTFPCSSYYAQHHAYHLPKVLGSTQFPTVLCGYTAGQVRRAYGYSPRNMGKGVTVALVEDGLSPDMFLTLQDFASRNRIQTPSASRYSELALGQGDACGDPFNVEEQIDVEMAYTMAPLANELVVGGDSCDDGYFGLQSVLDADISVLNGVGGHPLANITSNSWGLFDEESAPPEVLKIEHSYLVRAAAEGVSMLFATGDESGVQTPALDPYATAVGGTTLGIGLKDPRVFETGWSDDGYLNTGTSWLNQGENGAAGGGQSLLWAQPAYQRGVVPKSLATPPGNRGGLVRTIPDISALADPFTGFAVGFLNFNSQGEPTSYFETPYGGTSVATPLVAGMVADAEQGQHPFGFLNPALYRLAGTSAIHDALPITSKTPAVDRGVVCDAAMCGLLTLTAFDDQSFSMMGYTGQVTAKGYDSMTGIGTPNGENFINALRRVEKK